MRAVRPAQHARSPRDPTRTRSLPLGPRRQRPHVLAPHDQRPGPRRPFASPTARPHAVRASFLLQRAPNGPAEISGRNHRGLPSRAGPRDLRPSPLNRPRTPCSPSHALAPPPTLAAASMPLCPAAPLLRRGPATPRPPSPGQQPLELRPVPKTFPRACCPRPPAYSARISTWTSTAGEPTYKQFLATGGFPTSLTPLDSSQELHEASRGSQEPGEPPRQPRPRHHAIAAAELRRRRLCAPSLLTPGLR